MLSGVYTYMCAGTCMKGCVCVCTYCKEIMNFVKATVSKEVQVEARLQIIKECLNGKAVEIAGVDYS